MFCRIITLVLILYAVSAAQASAAPTSTTACAGLNVYAIDIVSVLDADDMERLETIIDKDWETLRPSQLRTASDLMDEWAGGLEEFGASDIPAAAEDYHESLIDFLGVGSAVFNAMATGGVFATIPYTEEMEEAVAGLESASAAGERECGSRWPFDGNEGSEL